MVLSNLTVETKELTGNPFATFYRDLGKKCVAAIWNEELSACNVPTTTVHHFDKYVVNGDMAALIKAKTKQFSVWHNACFQRLGSLDQSCLIFDPFL